MAHYTSKNRNLKNKASIFLQTTWQNFYRSSWSIKLALVGTMIGLLGLLAPWMSVSQKSFNSFSLITGFAGYIFLAVYAYVAVMVLNISRKQELKNKMGVIFQDYSVLVFSGVLILVVTMSLFFSFLGYQSDVGAGVYISPFSSGIMFEIIAGILVFISGVVTYRERKMEVLKKIYVQNSGISSDQMADYDSILTDVEVKDKNMQLPI